MKREIGSILEYNPKECNKQRKLTTGALSFELVASSGFARSSVISLPHGQVLTPVFMPVGTYGAMKGIPSPDLEKLGPQIILANTYHVGNRPGAEFLQREGGLHKFMKWNRNMLTDSGGFQMVSLAKLLSLSEKGVEFESPVDHSKMLLTPELSMEIQNAIGADIMMVLDDVVESTSEDRVRMKEATERTIRWLDRCIAAHKRPESQNLFAIVQGGLDADLRDWSLAETIKRDTPGFAIGGLSGGEGKEAFWRVVAQCCKSLPELKPRYVMGVGYPLDILCCVALGADMFDCVYPTRTARFGTALVPAGQMRLSNSAFKSDPKVVQEGCPCRTCTGGYSRAYLHHLAGRDPVVARLLSEHNVVFMMTFMAQIRAAINTNTFEDFASDFLIKMFPKNRPPIWVRNALVEGAKLSMSRVAFIYCLTLVAGSIHPPMWGEMKVIATTLKMINKDFDRMLIAKMAHDPNYTFDSLTFLRNMNRIKLSAEPLIMESDLTLLADNIVELETWASRVIDYGRFWKVVPAEEYKKNLTQLIEIVKITGENILQNIEAQIFPLPMQKPLLHMFTLF